MAKRRQAEKGKPQAAINAWGPGDWFDMPIPDVLVMAARFEQQNLANQGLIRQSGDRSNNLLKDFDCVPEDLLQSLPAETVTAYQEAVAGIDTKRLKLAVEFQPHFNALANALAKAFPTETYEAMKAAKDILNTELRSRGFAVKCPKSGRPSFILVRPDDRPGMGRMFFAHTVDGKTKTSVSSTEFPEFELMLEQGNPALEESRIKSHAQKELDRSTEGYGGRQ